MKQVGQEVELDLSDQDLTNEKLAQKLQEYPMITELDIMSNQNLSDISPISRFTELRVLNISNTAIVDLTPLKGFKYLTVFLADVAKIADISPLSDSTGLEILILTCTQVDNSVFKTLKCFTELRDLSLSYTRISGDISNLSVLTNLKCLTLCETDIDASSLLKLNTLKKLTRLSVDPECEWAKKDLTSMLPSLKNSALKDDSYNSLNNISISLNIIELKIQKHHADNELQSILWHIDSQLTFIEKKYSMILF